MRDRKIQGLWADPDRRGMAPLHRTFVVIASALACGILLLPGGALAAGGKQGRDGSHKHQHRAHRATKHKVGPSRVSEPRDKADKAGARRHGRRKKARNGGATSQVPVAGSQSGPTSAPPEPAAAPPAPEGKVTFAALFDGSFSGLLVQSLPSRATINPAHPFEGSAAARFEVRPGDVEPETGSQRSELTGPTFHEGEDVYVRDDIRVPTGYTFQGPWQLIDQLHETPWTGSPGIATFLDAERRISFGAGDGSPMYWRGPQLEQERWYDLVYRVNLSRNPAEGFVELWLDGVPQTLLDGQTRMYGETIQAAETYLKAGIYRSLSSTGVSVVEHDNLVVGTSLAAVMSF